MWGLDPGQTRGLAGRLRASAQRVDTLLGSLGRDIAGLDWQGPDADAFRTEWTGQASPQLGEVVRRLREQADGLMREAETQERASRGAP